MSIMTAIWVVTHRAEAGGAENVATTQAKTSAASVRSPSRAQVIDHPLRDPSGSPKSTRSSASTQPGTSQAGGSNPFASASRSQSPSSLELSESFEMVENPGSKPSTPA